jgi:hypothetical protein
MGALGVSERIIGISIISYGRNSLDLRPTWVTTSPRERIEFASQGPTVSNLHNYHINVCVSVAFITQRAKCIALTMLSSLACHAPPYFTTLCHKWRGYRGKKKNVTGHKMCVFNFSTTFDRNIAYQMRNRVPLL